jgi:hypothetical protein
MVEIAPRSAARRLAAELKLPSYKGAVLYATQGNEPVLIVAADGIWRSRITIPTRYCGYRVVQEDGIHALAHA